MAVDIAICRWPIEGDNDSDVIEIEQNGQAPVSVFVVNDMRLFRLLKANRFDEIQNSGIKVDKIYQNIPDFLCDIRNLDLSGEQARNFAHLLSLCDENGHFIAIT